MRVVLISARFVYVGNQLALTVSHEKIKEHRTKKKKNDNVCRQMSNETDIGNFRNILAFYTAQ